MEPKYVKVPIYPLARYLPPEKRRRLVAPMVPQVFVFDGKIITVSYTEMCERAVSRKAGGRGFRYTCYIRWDAGGKEKAQRSIIWYDDFLEEWFVEVPEGSEPKDWDTASQETIMDEHLNKNLEQYAEE